jgi:EAL domain-containing protein (putative c-di-GMP-specific phosphodiesterase class I)
MHSNPLIAPCDCAELVPSGLPSGLALRATTTHVRRRLRVLLPTLGLPTHDLGDSVLLRAEDFARLVDLARSLSATERADVLVAPCERGVVDAWQAAPIMSWVQRIESPWFDEACGGLFPHLQPVVSFSDGEVYGYEALLRSHVGGQLMVAGPLLAAAASRGRLRALDALARQTAIEAAYPRLPDHAYLFINFSPGVVYNPDVCLERTFRACERVGAEVGRLVFEVTESEAFPELPLLKRILDRYRREGAQVALDDLGAGHTSLTYLDELRPDIVKLDRGLVRGLTAHDPRTELVGALVRYAHDLGVRVVAEGIETETELLLMRDLGADYAQGYFIARPATEPPAPSPEFRALLGG